VHIRKIFRNRPRSCVTGRGRNAGRYRDRSQGRRQSKRRSRPRCPSRSESAARTLAGDRVGRFHETFFDDLDELLPPERPADGPPSARVSSSATFLSLRSARRRLRVQHARGRRVRRPTGPRAKRDPRTDRGLVRDSHAAGRSRPQCRDRTIRVAPPLDFAELPSGSQSPASSRLLPRVRGARMRRCSHLTSPECVIP